MPYDSLSLPVLASIEGNILSIIFFCFSLPLSSPLWSPFHSYYIISLALEKVTGDFLICKPCNLFATPFDLVSLHVWHYDSHLLENFPSLSFWDTALSWHFSAHLSFWVTAAGLFISDLSLMPPFRRAQAWFSSHCTCSFLFNPIYSYVIYDHLYAHMFQ